MMKKKCLVALGAAFMFSWGCLAQTRDIHIVSTNDMHAAIDNMPMLSDVVDSLRTIDNQTLVFSAGDNRTGNPVNDMYSRTTYPMVSLMNFIGFDGSAFGNHEFDNRPDGLRRVLADCNFPHICANFKADPELNIHPVPYVIYEVEGVKVGVLGVVELGTSGYPDAHPDLMMGMTFTQPEETIKEYQWLRDKVDVFILLSHLGYEDDVKMADKFPFFDVILGGHTHTQLEGGEMHNGVLITQNVNKLKRATYTTIKVVDGKVVSKKAETIDVSTRKSKNPVAQNIVDFFNGNPEFKRQLAVLENDVTTQEQMGCMMCDAWISELGADVAVQNLGGVRYGEKKAGPITVNDVLTLDPFGNNCVEMNLTGEELRQLLLSCYHNDSGWFPYVGGLVCQVTLDPADSTKVKSLKLLTEDGKKFNLKKTYKVVTNDFVAAICDSPRKDEGRNTGLKTADVIIKFLEKKGKVDYHGVQRVFFNK